MRFFTTMGKQPFYKLRSGNHPWESRTRQFLKGWQRLCHFSNSKHFTIPWTLMNFAAFPFCGIVSSPFQYFFQSQQIKYRHISIYKSTLPLDQIQEIKEDQRTIVRSVITGATVNLPGEVFTNTPLLKSRVDTIQQFCIHSDCLTDIYRL